MQTLMQKPKSGSQQIVDAFKNSSVLLKALEAPHKLVSLTAKTKSPKQVAFKLSESLKRGEAAISDQLRNLQKLCELEST
jgi:hypothetical protein